jgi:hypothetical protein
MEEVGGSVVVWGTMLQTEGRGFESQCAYRISLIYLVLPAALGPGVFSASNLNDYQEQKNNFSGD